MWKIKNKESSKVKYRLYSPNSMTAAYVKVRESGAAIKTTAKEFGVPESSLRHKLSGRVNPEATRSGPPPLFSMEEEARFADHLKFTASVGYGYSRYKAPNTNGGPAEDPTPDYMNLLGMIFSMCGLMMKLKWCAWCAVFCSFIGFANSRASEDTKQTLSSFMLSISAVVMSYLQNPQPMTPPWQ